MDCDQFNFCPKLSHKRIEQAKTIFGSHVIKRILSWSLYLLGASKPMICSALDFKPGTLRTLLYRVHNDGLSALEDRRIKGGTLQPKPEPEEPELSKVSLGEIEGEYHINLSGSQLNIPVSNPLLYKSILLCLLNNKLLSRREVANALQLSEDRAGRLAKKLSEEDVEGLLDQRQGQQQDYVFTPEVKGELIQQFVIDIVQDGKVSGESLSDHLKERCQYSLSPRSILRYLSDMGLSNIRRTLPNYLDAAKKKSSKF